MFEVIIADDENIVRLGLRSIINWEEHGFKISGIFSNGKEALDFCKSHRTHVLITDIKMPVLDGISLIKEVKKEIPDIKIIVLSNYDDFQYVSEAFKIGIDEYLLKQFMEPDKLLEILQKVRIKLSQEPELPSVNTVQKNISIEKEEFLHSLLLGSKLHPDDFNEKFETLELHMEEFYIYCLTIKLYKKVGNVFESYKGFSPSRLFVKNAIIDCINKYCNVGLLIEENDLIIAVIQFNRKYKQSEIFYKIKDIFNDICNTSINYFDLYTYIGCSNVCQIPSNLSRAFTESMLALDSTFFIPSQNTMCYSTSGNIEPYPKNLCELEKEIYTAMDIHNFEKLQHSVIKFTQMHKDKMIISPDEFKKKLLRIIQGIDILMFKEFNVNLQYLFENNEQNVGDNIQNAPNILIACDILTSLLHLVKEHINGNHNIIFEAKKYIIENYMKDIGLSDISQYLSINSTYFCQLFKAKTGENFSYYLCKLRIEKSIDLLKKTKMSTEEIAESVGYPNVNYFIKVFKKITGKTLSEFKKE